MKKSVYIPYNFDEKYEYKTYKNVGLDYKKSKLKNKKVDINKKGYKVCNTYSEWRDYVKSNVKKDFINYEDFLHWLYYMKNYSEEKLEIVKSIQIPIYIVLVSFSMQSYTLEHTTTLLGFIGVLGLVAFASVGLLINACEKVRFYDDIINICKIEFRESDENK